MNRHKCCVPKWYDIIALNRKYCKYIQEHDISFKLEYLHVYYLYANFTLWKQDCPLLLKAIPSKVEMSFPFEPKPFMLHGPLRGEYHIDQCFDVKPAVAKNRPAGV